MRIDFIADTNILIYVHEGNKLIEPFLIYNFGISFITEIELLGFGGLTSVEEDKLRQLIKDCYELGWNNDVKEQAILLRKKYVVKLPDAIIAATAIVHELPLVTADRGLVKIEELDLIFLDV
jgi:predicted nucleic acid-binding protein